MHILKLLLSGVKLVEYKEGCSLGWSTFPTLLNQVLVCLSPPLLRRKVAASTGIERCAKLRESIPFLPLYLQLELSSLRREGIRERKSCLHSPTSAWMSTEVFAPTEGCKGPGLIGTSFHVRSFPAHHPIVRVLPRALGKSSESHEGATQY